MMDIHLVHNHFSVQLFLAVLLKNGYTKKLRIVSKSSVTFCRIPPLSHECALSQRPGPVGRTRFKVL